MVTIVVPSGKIEPEAGLFEVATLPSTSSMAEVVKFTNAPAGPEASAVISDGTLMTGGVVSSTMMLIVPVARPPRPSETM